MNVRCALSPSGSLDRQRGGMTIVMALILLAVMSLAAFSLSRNAIRELSTTGHVIQGGKASEAADAGLDWFIVWSLPPNMTLSIATPGATGSYNLARALSDIADNWPNFYAPLQADGLLAYTSASRNWDPAALITSTESQTTSNDMAFDNTSASAVYQAKNSGGSPVVQRFDLLVRFLGQERVKETGLSSGGPIGLNTPTAGQNNLWQVMSTGYAAVPIGGGDYLRYQQRREMIITTPPSSVLAK